MNWTNEWAVDPSHINKADSLKAMAILVSISAYILDTRAATAMWEYELG